MFFHYHFLFRDKCFGSYNKYAIYYNINKDTKIIKPRDLIEIRNFIEQEFKQNQSEKLKTDILNYIRKKYNNYELKHVICEVDDTTDIADLHTLFNTADVEKVVEGYAEAFSAVYWNYIDEKDESAFQVPSMMIMDSNCMDIEQIIKNISYQRRNNGVDKLTGKSTIELNATNFKKILEAELNINNAVNLLKMKEILGRSDFSLLIDDKLQNYKYLDDAKQIVEQDKICNEYYIVSNEDKKKVKGEISTNIELQRKLETNHLKHTGQIDIYMATYVEMLEEINRQEFFNERKNVQEKNQTNKNSQYEYDER